MPSSSCLAKPARCPGPSPCGTGASGWRTLGRHCEEGGGPGGGAGRQSCPALFGTEATTWNPAPRFSIARSQVLPLPNRLQVSLQGPAAALGLTQPPGHVVPARPTPLAQRPRALPHESSTFHGSPSYSPVRTAKSSERQKQVSLPRPLPCGRGSGLSAGQAGWQAPTCTCGAGRSHTVTAARSFLNPTLSPSPPPAKIQTFFSRRFKRNPQGKGLFPQHSPAGGHPSEESHPPSLSRCDYYCT